MSDRGVRRWKSPAGSASLLVLTLIAMLASSSSALAEPKVAKAPRLQRPSAIKLPNSIQRPKFKRTSRLWASRTLERKKNHTLALFATRWDGYADRMAKGVESAMEGLVSGPGADHLVNLTLLRLDTTFKDLPSLKQKFHLQMELPAFFYFR